MTHRSSNVSTTPPTVEDTATPALVAVYDLLREIARRPQPSDHNQNVGHDDTDDEQQRAA